MQTQLNTFPCPNCNEIINDTSDKCRFCSAPIDRQAATAAGEIQSKVNQACSDASFLRIAAVTMWIFLGLQVIPFIPLVGWGFIATFFVVIVLIIRWMVKFGGLQTNDKDFQQAKRSAILAVILWLAALVGFIILSTLQKMIFRL